MNEKLLKEISMKLTAVIALLARQDGKITKTIDTTLDFFEGFGLDSSQDVANILGVNPRAVANAKTKRKAKTEKK